MSYSKNQLMELCAEGIKVAKVAGNKILYYYNNFNKQTDIKIKLDNSPVTTADLAAHDEIIAGLNKLLKLPILSEESNNINTAIRLAWDDYWLVDPIDGTKEFIAKNGEFCINIALIHQHRPIIGIIYAPYYDLLYYAVLNSGAYKTEKNISLMKIKTNHINDKTISTKGIVIATSRRHANSSKYNNFINYLKINNIKYNTIISGSAIKFGLVAEGKADLYPRFGLTSEWDSAAGDCIIHEAGGVVKNLGDEILEYNTKESLINPEFYVAGDKNFAWIDIFSKINTIK